MRVDLDHPHWNRNDDNDLRKNCNFDIRGIIYSNEDKHNNYETAYRIFSTILDSGFSSALD